MLAGGPHSQTVAFTHRKNPAMKPKSFPLLGAALALALGGPLTPVADRAAAAPAPPAPAGDTTRQDMDVLTRGPVHEAFAETVSYNPTPGVTIQKAPPAAIEEVPPDQRPEGDNVAWISGYWAWDDETNDFLWISGVWRNLPPGRQWVPGYWNPLDNGYQWISGYWSSEESTVTDYLPEPPATLESGPSVAAPSRNHVWTPGYWAWRDERYGWTPGYWQLAQPNWLWVPAHYVWTPRGYIFVSGYWDYAVARRGVLFAPVYFHGGYYADPGYYYTPATVITIGLFLDHLFLRPGYGHYYYGDYYAPRYRDYGYFASYSYYGSRRGYDPILMHQYWRHRDDRNWLRTREQAFMSLRDNEALRPARTFRDLRARGDAQALALAEPLDRYAKDKHSPMKFKPLKDAERQQIVAQRQATREFGMKRKTLEAAAAATPGEGAKRTKPEKIELAASPLRGKSTAKFGKGEGPPKLPPVRQPVLKPEATESAVPGKPSGRSDEAPGRREITPSRKGEAPGAREPGDTGSRKDEAPGRREISPSRKGEAPGKPSPERIAPAPERRVVPKEEPRETPKVERRVEPKPEPREAPKVERRVEPRPEPREAPKVERRAAPQPESRVQPAPQPRREAAQPGSSGGGQRQQQPQKGKKNADDTERN